MKIPAKFNKMTPSEQETWLVNKSLKLQKEMDAIRKLLAAIRGGKRVELAVDERPDEIALKVS